MKNLRFNSRLLLACLCTFGLALPAHADNTGSQKPLLVASTKAKKASAESHEAIQKKLEEFAYNTICSMNRCIIPSSGKKEIKRNADGTFTARYIEIDVNSITTSYKKPDNAGPVSYIGFMNYEEIEYISTGKNKNEAGQGPFSPKRREIMTELIKYIKGKWTY